MDSAPVNNENFITETETALKYFLNKGIKDERRR